MCVIVVLCVVMFVCDSYCVYACAYVVMFHYGSVGLFCLGIIDRMCVLCCDGAFMCC